MDICIMCLGKEGIAIDSHDCIDATELLEQLQSTANQQG